ncbi:MAG: SRPBCC family protein, partial [Actinomycetota bacterium]
MPTLQVTRTTDKSPEALWEVLADFPNIANWYTGLKTSVSTSDAANGVGATRHCELTPVGAIDERILDWEEGSRVRIAAEKYEKAPIKHGIADFRITPEGDRTRLDLSFDFTAKGGVAGKAAAPALKAALTKGFNQML